VPAAQARAFVTRRELKHRAAFEQMGETQARVRAQETGEVGAEAVAWLAERESERASAAAAKRDALEERIASIASEALSIAKEANRIASEEAAAARSSACAAERAACAAERQARWALYATIIATIAAAISTKDQILALILGSP
jgi:hypothetical protein